MIDSIADFFDSRLRLSKFFRAAINHVFPDHWSFMLGEISLYSFIILVITGTFLAMFFKDSSDQVLYSGSYHPLVGTQMSEAYRSVLHISFDVPAGLLVRQMHHWACDIFLGSIIAHQARIFFTAAYRRPREINWIIGMTLLLLALANGYFGYSICGDELSGAGMRIGYSIMLSVPVIGPWLVSIVFGGTVPAVATIPRWYALHIYLVPAVIAVLIGAHLAIIWRQYHTNYPGPGRTEETIVGSRLWPSYTFKSLGLFALLFALIAALGGLVQIDPVWVYGPYNPMGILPGAQPDWYLGWIEGAMRLFPGVNLHFGRYLVPEVFFPAVAFPLLVFAILYAYPFLEKLANLDFRNHNVLLMPWEQPFNTAVGCGLLMLMLVLLFAGGDDVVAIVWNGSVISIREYLRILVFLAPGVTGVVTYYICKATKRKHAAAARADEISKKLTSGEPAPQEQ